MRIADSDSDNGVAHADGIVIGVVDALIQPLFVQFSIQVKIRIAGQFLASVTGKEAEGMRLKDLTQSRGARRLITLSCDIVSRGALKKTVWYEMKTDATSM